MKCILPPNSVASKLVLPVTVIHFLFVDICKDKFKIKYPDVVFRAGNATLTCDCPSVPTPTYTWQKDGNVLATTGKNLVITDAQKARDDGEYVCVVNSGSKKATSLPHRLNILSK